MGMAPPLVKKQKRSSVTGVSSGAPFSFQSGISSFRALRIDHRAGKDMRPDLRAFFQHADLSFPATAACSRMAAASPAGPPPTITTS